MAVLFYSFGHLANVLEGLFRARGIRPDLILLLAVWIGVFLVLSFVIVRSRPPRGMTEFLNVTGVIVALFPIGSIFSTAPLMMGDNRSEVAYLFAIRRDADAEASMNPMASASLPDIYYIILDGYTRADILGQYYGYDNSGFVESLEDRGFYVVSSSRSNFLSTTYSLNTSLNLIYFNDFPASLAKTARFNLRTNYVSDFLRKLNYQVVVFDSGTGDSNNQYADLFLAAESSRPKRQSSINAFEQLLIRTTLGLPMVDKDSRPDDPGQPDNALNLAVDAEIARRRERIHYALTHLADFASSPGSHFIFAHIYLPHEPFLYGPGGEELKYQGETNLYWYEWPPADYVEYYGYQITYLDKAILSAIDAILAESDGPVIIVLQGDHGDGHYLDWNHPTTKGVNIRSTIFNAIYFSDHAYASFYPSMTPVNTFRLVFNHWYGTRFPVLGDRVFFHEHPVMTPLNESPKFMDACLQFAICLPAHGG